jgi:hypothetical protein
MAFVSRACSAAFLLSALALASCGSKGTVVVALDEAFAASRPGLAQELAEGPGFSSGYRVEAVTLKLGEGPGAALAALASCRAKGGAPVALVASPLLAAALPGPWRAAGAEESSAGAGITVLLPEWSAREGARAGFAAAATDPLPAYATAGAAAGAYIASLRVQGSAATGAVLFREAPARPRAALEAFVAAFEESSGGIPPLVRELYPAEDEDSAPESAVRELLGSDIRFLFVALGGGGPAAIRAATRPGLVIGADYHGPGAPEALAFRLRPDDRSIARSLWAALPPQRGRPRPEKINAVIELFPASKDLSRKAFSPFLRYAEQRNGAF